MPLEKAAFMLLLKKRPVDFAFDGIMFRWQKLGVGSKKNFIPFIISSVLFFVYSLD